MLSRRRSRAASRTTSWPSTRTVPESGVSRVARIDSCPHVGTPLDLWPNEFFTEDGQALVCSTHGAIFEPHTGFCTGGPCAGDRLTRLPLRVEDASLVVTCP